MNNTESYVKNCLIKSRGEPLFNGSGGQGVIVQLDGYAIIPLEEYYALTGKEPPEMHAAYRPSAPTDQEG